MSGSEILKKLQRWRDQISQYHMQWRLQHALCMLMRDVGGPRDSLASNNRNCLPERQICILVLHFVNQLVNHMVEQSNDQPVSLGREPAGNGVSASPRAPRQAPAKIKFPRPPPAPASPRDPPSQPPPELGEYASGRPRRHTKTPGYRLGSSVEDEHQMVEPEHYRGIPGSGAAEAQPFRIEVTPTAQVMYGGLSTLLCQDNHAEHPSICILVSLLPACLVLSASSCRCRSLQCSSFLTAAIVKHHTFLSVS